MGYDVRAVLGEKLGRLRDHDILLVDEAHRLGFAEQEMLIEAIDDHIIPGPAADERKTIPPWTLILATDQPGRLLNALRKRIAHRVSLDYYRDGEVKEIVEVMASRMNILLSPQAAGLVAQVSGGLPRQAKQHLLALRLYYPDAERRKLAVADVRGYLDAEGFDGDGSGPLECRYLDVLARPGDGSYSLESIALALGCDQRYVRQEIESPLVRRGLVQVTPAGRRLTAAGWERADRRRPADSAHHGDGGP
jgi:Holliday junction DNA helicase RuvB